MEEKERSPENCGQKAAHTCWSPRQRRDEAAGITFEEVMDESFPRLMEKFSLQNPEVQQSQEQYPQT